MATPEQEAGQALPAKRSIFKKLLAGVLVLAVVVWFGAPVFVERTALDVVKTTFLENYGATANAEADFFWPGLVEISQLKAADPARQMELEIPKLSLDVQVMKALGGFYDTDITVSKPHLTLRGPLPEGRKKDAGESAGKPFPRLSARIGITDGRVTIIDATGHATTFSGINVRVLVEDLEKPIDITASLLDAVGGQMSLKTALTLIRDGKTAVDRVEGPLKLDFKRLSMAELAPAVRLYSPINTFDGVLDGTVDVQLSSLYSAKGLINLEVARFVVGSAGLGADPAKIQKLTINGQLDADAAGSGRQKISLSADEFLQIVVDATATSLRSDSGSIQADITSTLDLKGLHSAAPSALRLKPGFDIAGQGVLASKVTRTLGAGGATSVNLDYNIKNLQARDATGRSLPVDPTLSFKLIAESSAAGRTAVDLLDVRADAFTLNARGAYDAKTGEVREGGLDLRSDLSLFTQRFGSFLDLPLKLGGKVDGKTRIQGQGRQATLDGSIDFTRLTIAGFGDVEKKNEVFGPLDVSIKPNLALNLEPDGESKVNSFDIVSAGLGQLGFKGTLRDLLSAGSGRSLSGEMSVDLDAAALGRLGGPLLSTYVPKSGRVDGRVNLRENAGERSVQGQINGKNLLIELAPTPEKPEVRTLRQANLALFLDLTQDLNRSVNKIGELRVVTEGVDARLSGSKPFEGLAGTNLNLKGNLDIGDMLREFGALLGASTGDLDGQAVVNLDVRPLDSEINVAGTVGMTQLSSRDLGSTLKNENLDLNFNTTLDSEMNSVRIQELRLNSNFLAGSLNGAMHDLASEPRFSGLKGRFTYVPDKLGAVISPWFAGKFTGKDRQKIELDLDGKAASTHWLDVLRGSQGNGIVGIGGLSYYGFKTTGNLGVDLKEQKLISNSDLGLNGGKLKLNGNVDLRENAEAKSSFTFGMSGAQADSEMSPLLQIINPIFAVADGSGNLISALIDADVRLDYNAPLSKEMLAGGWAALPKRPINGQGRIGLTNVGVGTTGLMGILLQTLGIARLDQVVMDPVEFRITNGRLQYAKPLAMNLGGVATEWTGTIGLDKTLDLSWNIPVTEQMVAKNSFLKFFQGSKLQIPLGGTTESPVLKVEQVFANLAQQAAARVIQDKAGNVLGDKTKDALGGVVDPGKLEEIVKKPEEAVTDVIGGALGGLFGDKDEAAAKDTLAKADKLWTDNKKSEAQPLYKRLIEKFKKTKIYKQNAQRIDERAK